VRLGKGAIAEVTSDTDIAGFAITLTPIEPLLLALSLVASGAVSQTFLGGGMLAAVGGGAAKPNADGGGGKLEDKGAWTKPWVIGRPNPCGAVNEEVGGCPLGGVKPYNEDGRDMPGDGTPIPLSAGREGGIPGGRGGGGIIAAGVGSCVRQSSSIGKSV